MFEHLSGGDRRHCFSVIRELCHFPCVYCKRSAEGSLGSNTILNHPHLILNTLKQKTFLNFFSVKRWHVVMDFTPCLYVLFKVSFNGASGPVQFDEKGQRTNYKLDVMELASDSGIEKVT